MDTAFKSYIERRFIVAMLMSEQFTFEPLGPPLVAIARDAQGITLAHRVPVGRYFVDFTLTHEAVGQKLAIELDGHQWHRRTASEAEYEARRDRDVTDEGWTIIRYMGAEVMRDPLGIARDAYERIRRSLGPGLVHTKPSAEEQVSLALESARRPTIRPSPSTS